MNRLTKSEYEHMPWAETQSKAFLKPQFEQISQLKKIPIHRRSVVYSEFYELESFIDLVSEAPRGRLLDLGAGTGNLSYYFLKQGWDVTAADIDDLHFGADKSIFNKTDLNNNLEFSNSSFDCVISKQTIEHLISPYHFIAEIARVLKPDGIAILSSPNTTSLLSRWNVLRTGIPDGFTGTRWNYGGHMSPVFCSQVEAFMKAGGIEKISFHTNRYILFDLHPVYGVRKQFLGPFLRLFSYSNMHDACLYGEKLIVMGVKNR